MDMFFLRSGGVMTTIDAVLEISPELSDMWVITVGENILFRVSMGIFWHVPIGNIRLEYLECFLQEVL